MSSLPLVLGLDISKSRTGICWGRVGQTPQFASVVGSDHDIDAASFRLLKWVSEFARLESVDVAFIEAQILGFGNDVQKLRQQVPTMLAIRDMMRAARLALYGRSVPIREVSSTTARVSFIGNGKLKSEPAKKAAMSMCKALGWEPSNYDESDAGAVWFHGCLQVKPHACQIVTPMMQARIVGLSLGAKYASA